MKKDIKYITIDGRGEHDSFRDCITKALEDLKSNEGIHIIKDFEPFPMYKMMESKGFDKHLEKISDEEYHVYFYPKTKLNNIEMTNHLKVDNERIQRMLDIKLDYLNGRISLEVAKNMMKDSFEKITAEEFAVAEQHLKSYGISDDTLTERLKDILEIFDGILVSTEVDAPKGHPIRTYMDETAEIKKVLSAMKDLLQKKFIKNQWLELYDKLSQISIHFSRKQNQLFPALERKGFDKPSKVMWTLDNNIRDIIRESKTLLNENKDEKFLAIQPEVIDMIKDMMIKENEILFPTAMEMLSNQDFAEMRISDDEIGYCLIENPPAFINPDSKVSNNALGNSENLNVDLLKDLAAVLEKHGVTTQAKEDEILNVSQGLLTLKQINLIFKHLPMDLTFVDENELVKFYSDTKHRIFPRSAGVIGREVQNCHPRESVDTVEKIIDAFRKGTHDEAEFWLEMGGKFIYIIYTAVRDEQGTFKGVLEMMQDVTHIRSLTGSQRLLTWKNDDNNSSNTEEIVEVTQNEYNITKNTNIGGLLKEYPYLKGFLISLSPKFEKLNSPIFKTMAGVASLEMISARGGFEVSDLIDKIVTEIDKNNK
ncbi:PAS domain-containing protein [Clostridium sp.]|uniref:PAS domain-containing protein n=1 Tax=Clostridium sp. TaxID=1506 RepID=UPI002FC63CEA